MRACRGDRDGDCDICAAAADMGGAVMPEHDMVNSPPHYRRGGIETIEIIRAMLTDDEFRGYLKGNILKYRERAEHKGNADQDYAKARWYMDRLIADHESTNHKPIKQEGD